MPLPVRPASYDSDTQELVETLQRNMPQLPHARYFQWTYLENPEGRALTWVITDSGRIVGVAAAFPRRLYSAGEEVRGYLLGDFCIDQRHRSLGIAVALQRACLEGLRAAHANFVFDFPSRVMLSIYQRLHIETGGSIVRHAKPLRADRKVAQHVPVRPVAQGLTAIANAGLRLRDMGAKRNREYAVAVEPGPWGNEFTDAAQQWSPGIGICVARTSAYLNWRYHRHPEHQYEMLAARREGRLRGYMLYHGDAENCIVDDLFAEDDAARGALLDELTGLARRQRRHTLSVPWLATHPGKRLLEENGFTPRDSSPVVVLDLSGTGQPNPTDGAGWYLSYGDWEA